MQSSTLRHLLHLTWSSPVFGNAYPPGVSVNAETVMEQVENIYQRFVTTLTPILANGMPLATSEEVAEIIRQIAPKSIAFCSAIAAGEADDIERLRAAAVSIALVYWADQSMDRGDEAMLAAVRLLNNGAHAKPSMLPSSLAWEIQSRLAGLRWIERSVEHLSCPEDAAILLQCVYQDTLQNEARMRELSRRYALSTLRGDGVDFWTSYADEIAKLSIVDVAFIYVTSAIYAIYRHQQPELPSLFEIFNQPQLMAVLEGPCNAAIRVFDDFGDQRMDSGQFPAWGEFYLNLFNQPEPLLVRAFLQHAGLKDERVFSSVAHAFQTGGRISWVYVIQVFTDLAREQLAALPAATWQRYGTFLTLAKRVIDAGCVNMLGDMELADRMVPIPATALELRV